MWLLFPSLNIFDAFELGVNVVDFVYYVKTRIEINVFLAQVCYLYLQGLYQLKIKITIYFLQIWQNRLS